MHPLSSFLKFPEPTKPPKGRYTHDQDVVIGDIIERWLGMRFETHGKAYSKEIGLWMGVLKRVGLSTILATLRYAKEQHEKTKDEKWKNGRFLVVILKKKNQ